MTSRTQKKIKLLNLIIATLTVILLAVMLGYVVPSMLADERIVIVSSKAALRRAKFNEDNKKAEEQQIVFIGDSIVEFYDTDKYFPDIVVYNRGISGDRTNHVLERIEQNALAINPSIIVIHVGTNDLGAKLEYNIIMSNMEKIVKTIRKHDPNIKVVLDNVYPINDENRFFYGRIYGVRENYQIIELNSRLKKYALEHNIDFIDSYATLSDSEGRLKKEYTVDGLHLSPEGYKVVTELIMPYLQ